ncbi:hypothetical protein BD413DRAFT_6231 [Trametes elegans]|nr:hypothetical protein BD413DRAFT_6231 [Trametes elegans]
MCLRGSGISLSQIEKDSRPLAFRSFCGRRWPFLPPPSSPCSVQPPYPARNNYHARWGRKELPPLVWIKSTRVWLTSFNLQPPTGQSQMYAGTSQARPPVGRASYTIRKPRTSIRPQDQDEDEIEDIEEDASGDGEGEDESMMEMLSVLQEFQKRKASKSSARSVAFQNQKTMLFAEARKKVEQTLRDGTAAIDQARSTIAHLQSREVSQEGTLGALKGLWIGQDNCVQVVLGDCNKIIEDLAHRRAEQINESSAMLEAHMVERENSRRRLLAHARVCIEENIENQKIITDANSLMKHYKALLRS